MTAWIGVASREHVANAVAGGFCQFNHGKQAPLRRLQPDDRIVYYAPREKMRAGEIVQAFVALGTVMPGEPYQPDAANGFRPFRRPVTYATSTDASIRPLLQQLSFTRDRTSCGQAFRHGLFEIKPGDLEVIARAMNIALTSLG